MDPYRNFLLEALDDCGQAHDAAPDDTNERLWNLRCKFDERVRQLYRRARDGRGQEKEKSAEKAKQKWDGIVNRRKR